MCRIASPALLCVVLATPAFAQSPASLSDGECWARFMLVRSASEANPELLGRMGDGSRAATKAYITAHPEERSSEVDEKLRAFALALDAKLRGRETSGDNVMAEINTCEARYVLPLTDFSKIG